MGESQRLNIYITKELLTRLEQWRQAQPVPPQRSATIEEAVRRFLDAEDKAAALAAKAGVA
jgi:metal-responsive CopG/Arc/MetJ family transcriptional regulator